MSADQFGQRSIMCKWLPARVALAPSEYRRGSIIDRASLSFDGDGRFVLEIDFAGTSPVSEQRAGYQFCAGLAAWRAVDGLGPEDRYRRAALTHSGGRRASDPRAADDQR